MKTAALLKQYKQNDLPQPTTLWEKLVWMATSLIKTAEIERHTYRKPRGSRPKNDNQPDLFDQM